MGVNLKKVNINLEFVTERSIMTSQSQNCHKIYTSNPQVSQFSRWSHAERLLALDQLIESCEPQQVRHMMQVNND